MRSILTLIISTLLFNISSAQIVIEMEEQNGVFMIPCEVNGLKLKFIFDTGASDVSISTTEAGFMLKNGYLQKSDIKGSDKYFDANGSISEGTVINIKEIIIGGLKLNNVRASVVHNSNAPLLLGQSALSKLANIQFNYTEKTITLSPIEDQIIDEELFSDWVTNDPLICGDLNLKVKTFSIYKPRGMEKCIYCSVNFMQRE